MGSAGWALIQFLLRRKSGHRRVWEEDHVRTQGDGHLKPRREALEETALPNTLSLDA